MLYAHKVQLVRKLSRRKLTISTFRFFFEPPPPRLEILPVTTLSPPSELFLFNALALSPIFTSSASEGGTAGESCPFVEFGVEFEMLRGASDGGRWAWERAAETEAAGANMLTLRDLGFLPGTAL